MLQRLFRRSALLVFFSLTAALPAASVNPIDRIVEQYWASHSVRLPAPVNDSLFARRIYLDLWGLLPTPEQVAEFERDRAPDKRERLVRDLLANRRNYSEHWISFWNDLLRNDEGVLYEGARESITTWLLQALETNLPYDQFVGKLLNPAQPGDPKGFLIGVNWRGDVSASQIPPMQAAQNSAQVFLGVNLKCNSCHDSFISNWKLKDAYGLASFFSEGPMDIYRCDVKTGEKSAAKFLYPEIGGVDPNASLSDRRAAAARLFTCKEDIRFARTFVNRVWDRLLGHGVVASVDDMDRAPWDTELLDTVARDFMEHGYDIQFLLSRIMGSRAYQAPAVLESAEPRDFVFRGPLLRRLTAEQYVDAISSITGEWRVLAPEESGAGIYSREWRLKSSPLSRSLGRPIRDQVYTRRNTEATTLQALEVVNGETLDKLLERGAQRMLGRLPEAPPNVFDSGIVSGSPVDVDIDVTGIDRIWLLTEDTDSYDPARTVAGWLNPRLAGPKGETPLPAPLSDLQFKGHEPAKAFLTRVPSEQVFDIAGKGFTRFRATVGVDQKCLINEIGPRIRFFVFARKPDHEQLVRVKPGRPAPLHNESYTADSLITRLYRHALARDPEPAERRIALEFLHTAGDSTKISSEALSDLLWAVFQSPEFEFIH
ncbi:MAG TPA: DUF1549 domain-containing protein [Bryobacteraceae bacterium]|nr:DUF1549 domain-containing protein [Bryobacteraceae bacterium]